MSAVNYNQSRVKMFRRCQRQYAFRYDSAEGYEMVKQVSKLPLYRGTWMHALQEALHYQWAGLDKFRIQVGEGKRTGLLIEAENWKDVQAAMADKFENLFEEEKEDLGDLPDECEHMFRRYLRFWRADQEVYSVVELDGKPAIELIVEVPLDDFGLKDARFKGRIDLVVEDDEYGGAWIWDAKWVKNIPVPDERMMSPQAPLYVWALRKQYGLDVRGFVYNYGRTKPPTVPRILKSGAVTTRKSLDTDQYTYLRQIKVAHGKDYKRFLPYYKEKLLELKGREALWFDRQRIPVDDVTILNAVREYVATVRDIQRRETRPEYVPRSYFYNCRFGCDYHNPCVAAFAGNDISALVKQDFQFIGERYTKEEDLLNA
jgi:hypothetical protein